MQFEGNQMFELDVRIFLLLFLRLNLRFGGNKLSGGKRSETVITFCYLNVII